MPEYHDKETQRILRKVDFRLIPLLTFLYVLSFLDRSNIVRECPRAKGWRLRVSRYLLLSLLMQAAAVLTPLVFLCAG